MLQFLIWLALSTKCVLCANILYVSLLPSPSHQIWNRVFATGLGKKGHNVTLVDLEKNKEQFANYSHIYIEGAYDVMYSKFDPWVLASYTPTQTIAGTIEISIVVCEAALESQGLQQLLNYPPNFSFDLIIFDVTLDCCFYPLIHRFNYPPTIGTSPWPLPSFLIYPFGSPLQPSYTPWYALPYTDDMTLMERFWNHIFTYGETAFRPHIKNQLEEKLMETFGEDTPPPKKLEAHISLLLSNHDLLLNYPRALAPNIISVGGLHIPKTKEIPEDLESILNGAKNGIILFSLGTNMQSDFLTNQTQRSLVNAFANLSETIIWKYESDIDNLPRNVVVRKWLRQSDILGHPNVKLFIGHAGGLGTQEAIYHGVPMVCIPFFLDQHVNAKKIVREKLGLSLDYKKITTENFLSRVRQVLDNPVYSENIKTLSRMYRDRKEFPLETAIFWAEYAIRNNGCQILNTQTRNLPPYEAFNLDIVTLFILMCIVVGLLFYKVVNLLFSKLGILKLKTN
ncbi:hypothetical protein Zmor_008157 [Zophobas morio]|uniref:UDP-glucuronosyltransferase n=1 Tax=Zophobas morio TaxID=2755281 RepID=A0AA38IU53_9CUCU|nr:hypothetical protein Zmor_008157 [Zophobas morio]